MSGEELALWLQELGQPRFRAGQLFGWLHKRPAERFDQMSNLPRSLTELLEEQAVLSELSIRRKGFYERAGYRENPFSHVHPPYHAGYSGHSLMVMSCPEPLSEELYQEFDRYLKTVVMGRTL